MRLIFAERDRIFVDCSSCLDFVNFQIMERSACRNFVRFEVVQIVVKYDLIGITEQQDALREENMTLFHSLLNKGNSELFAEIFFKFRIVLLAQLGMQLSLIVKEHNMMQSNVFQRNFFILNCGR